MENEVQKLKDELDTLHMAYLSQVSLWKSMYEELQSKLDGKLCGVISGTKDKKPSRKDYNKAILAKLGVLIEKYPEQRFGQLITNYVFPHYRERDIFFDESKETYEMMVGEQQ